MARISVSLPSELMTRLEAIKDSVNISQVCREALERRVEAFERASVEEQPDLDLGSLIERLRQERQLTEGRFEQTARQNAAIWLNTASYAEVGEIGEEHSAPNMGKYKLPRSAFRQMKQDLEEAQAGDDGVQAGTYKTAWLDYVRAVWNQVTEQVEQPHGPVVGDGGPNGTPERNLVASDSADS